MALLKVKNDMLLSMNRGRVSLLVLHVDHEILKERQNAKI